MIKLIIFDLDDTLISEFDFIKSGYDVVSKYISQKYKINKEDAYQELIDLANLKAKNTFNLLLEKYNIVYSKEDILELVRMYRSHLPKITFYDDVRPVIDKLKSSGIKLGIISDGYIETQQNKLNVLNCKNTFDYIILTEELGREYWKPSPRAFEIMMEKFAITPQEAIYIGDNPEKDFYIKKYMPINTVRIKRDRGIYIDSKYKENIKEDKSINNLYELLDFIKDCKE